MLRHVVLPVSAIVITIPKGGYGFSQRSCANHRAVVEAHQKPVQRGAMRPSLLDPLFAALTTLPGVLNRRAWKTTEDYLAARTFGEASQWLENNAGEAH